MERSFAIPPPTGCSDLFLVFNVSRGKPIGIDPAKTAAELQVSLGEDEIPLPSNVLHLRVKETCGCKDVRVVSAAGALDLVKVICRHKDRKKLLVYAADKQGKLPEQPAEVDDRAEILREQILDPAKYVELFRSSLERRAAEEPEKDAARRYFFDLDRETHFDLVPLTLLSELERQFRREGIRIAMGLLRERLVERARLRQKNKDLTLTVAPQSEDRPFLESLSRLQIEVARRYFDLDQPAGIDGYVRAYEWFARGELRLHLEGYGWACQPSSGYYFFFGEFALFAWELGLDKAVWEKIAPVLVRTQETFAQIYAPTAGNGPLGFEAYAAANRRDPGQVAAPANGDGTQAGETVGDLFPRTADFVLRYLPAVVV